MKKQTNFVPCVKYKLLSQNLETMWTICSSHSVLQVNKVPRSSSLSVVWLYFVSSHLYKSVLQYILKQLALPFIPTITSLLFFFLLIFFIRNPFSIFLYTSFLELPAINYTVAEEAFAFKPKSLQVI